MTQPIISLVIPTYNSEKTIIKTLTSINQVLTVPNIFEIVIIDDGSTDNTLSLIHEFTDKSSITIDVHSNPHQGVSQSRNNGIKISNGQYIMFIDSDDILLNSPDFSELTTILDENPDLIFLCTDKPTKITTNIVAEQLQKNIIGIGNTFLGPTIFNKIYSRDFLLNNRLTFDTRLRVAEDLIFNFNCSLVAQKIAYFKLEKPFYQYTSSSSAHLFKEENLENELIFRNIILDILPQIQNDAAKEIKDKLGITGILFLTECYFAPLCRNKKMSLREFKIKLTNLITQGDYQNLSTNKFDHLLTKKEKILRKLLANKHYRLAIYFANLYDLLKGVQRI